MINDTLNEILQAEEEAEYGPELHAEGHAADGGVRSVPVRHVQVRLHQHRTVHPLL